MGEARVWNSRRNRSCMPGFRLYERISRIRVSAIFASCARLIAPAGARHPIAMMLIINDLIIVCPPFTMQESTGFPYRKLAGIGPRQQSAEGDSCYSHTGRTSTEPPSRAGGILEAMLIA